jgi:ferredoxin
MPAHFEVQEDECIGCALCPERAPENLEMVDGGAVARVIAQPASLDEELACLEAADYCPLGALSVTTPEPSNEARPELGVAAAISS